jgi:hypothetical protein
MSRAPRINIVDNCPWIAPQDTYLYRLLHRLFGAELSGDPDYVFYSVFGYAHSHPQFDRCVKIFFTGENLRPDFSLCDYALSFDHLENEPRHLRWPIYLHYLKQGDLIKRADFKAAEVLKAKSRFCNFVYSNPKAETRIRFFKELSKYKKVDSAGSVLNNQEEMVKDKLAFLNKYKFTIAFENSRHSGYTTEKLVEPMLADSLPIYWGNRAVGMEFNTRSFVNCHEHDSFESVIEEVIRLDQDDGRYIAKMKEPWTIGNTDSEYVKDAYSFQFFSRVFATPPHGYPKWSGVLPRNFADLASNDAGAVTGAPEYRDFE